MRPWLTRKIKKRRLTNPKSRWKTAAEESSTSSASFSTPLTALQFSTCLFLTRADTYSSVCTQTTVRVQRCRGSRVSWEDPSCANLQLYKDVSQLICRYRPWAGVSSAGWRTRWKREHLKMERPNEERISENRDSFSECGGFQLVSLSVL